MEMAIEHRQFEWIILYYANLGEMPEWSNGPVSKSGVCHRTEGSNPSLSLKQKAKPQGFAFCFNRMNVMRTLGRGFDWPRESEANTARSRITAFGRNPKGGEGNVVDRAVPSLSLLEREGVSPSGRGNFSLRESKFLTPWERGKASLVLRVWERISRESCKIEKKFPKNSFFLFGALFFVNFIRNLRKNGDF